GNAEYEMTNNTDFTTIFVREYDANGKSLKRDESIRVTEGNTITFTTFTKTRYFRIFFNDYDEEGIDVNDVGFRLRATLKPVSSHDVNENLLTHDLKLWENGSMYISNGKQVSSERRVRTKDYKIGRAWCREREYCT